MKSIIHSGEISLKNDLSIELKISIDGKESNIIVIDDNDRNSYSWNMLLKSFPKNHFLNFIDEIKDINRVGSIKLIKNYFNLSLNESIDYLDNLNKNIEYNNH